MYLVRMRFCQALAAQQFKVGESANAADSIGRSVNHGVMGLNPTLRRDYVVRFSSLSFPMEVQAL